MKSVLVHKFKLKNTVESLEKHVYYTYPGYLFKKKNDETLKNEMNLWFVYICTLFGWSNCKICRNILLHHCMKTIRILSKTMPAKQICI